MYIQNKHCYDFQLRDFPTPGLFDDFVDVTYIITSHKDLERNKKVEIELQKLIPTRKIYFVYNSTYKTCNKIIPQQIPPYDLKDANLNIMHHSLENGFNNILILENDFFYSDFLLKNKEIVVREINNFVNDLSSSEKPFAYNLGPNIQFCYPNFFSKHKNTYKLLLGAGAQAVIYNKKIQLEFINENGNGNLITNIFPDFDKNIDAYILFNYDVYFYNKPLIVQIYNDTENSNYWSENKLLNNIIKLPNKLFKLDTNPELGLSIQYKIVFFMNYLFSFIIFVFICWVFYYFFSRIFSTKKIFKFKTKIK